MYRTGPLWGGFVAALIGLAFCVSMLVGASDALCVTAGCSLLEGIQLAGFSLWWFGGAAFLLLGVLSLLAPAPFVRFAAAFALFVDCLLLLIMILIAPCLPCLVAGCLFALLYLLVRKATRDGDYSRRRSVLLPIWLILFFANAFPLGLQSVGAWNLAGSPDAPVRLYFSPSCPTCRAALKEAASVPVGRIAYIPVSENLDDIRVLARMRVLLAGSDSTNLSVDEALRRAIAEPDNSNGPDGPDWSNWSDWPTLLDTGWRVLRNRGMALAAGATRIPWMTVDGLPEHFFGALSGRAPAASPGAGPLDIAPGAFVDTRRPFGPDAFQGCGAGGGELPCD